MLSDELLHRCSMGSRQLTAAVPMYRLAVTEDRNKRSIRVEGDVKISWQLLQLFANGRW